MKPPIDIDEVVRMLKEFQIKATQARAAIRDPAIGGLFDEQLKALETCEAGLADSYRQLLADTEKRVAAAQANMAETVEKTKAALQARAAKKAAQAEQAAKPKPPAPDRGPRDAAHGLVLREELLKRFGPRPVPPVRDDETEIWEDDWEST